MRHFSCVSLAIVFLMLVGCATVDYSFVNPTAKVGAARKVAVFPFMASLDSYAALRVSGVSGDKAASLVNQIFVKELYRRTRYEIIAPVKVAESLSLDKDKMEWVYQSFLGNIYERGGLTPARLAELSSQLGAEAILVGKVTDLGRYQQDGVLWTGVGLTVKMIDLKTGEVLWEVRDRVKDVSTITHSYSALEGKAASYPIVSGGTAKEPKYKTGQGYFYGKAGEFPYHDSYETASLTLCRNIISTLPRY